MWQFPSGCVIIRISGKHPERLLNRLRENGVSVRRAYGATRGEMELTVRAQDFRRIRPLVRGTGCRVHILRREGALFWLVRLRRRPVLWIGIPLVLAAIQISSTRVMHIAVEGLNRVPEAIVLNALAEQGLRRFGAYPEKRLREIAVAARLYDERIAWISLMLTGSRLRVLVTEAEERVAATDPKKPCDVVAVKDGIVTEVRAYEGYTRLVPGDAVKAGDILFAGEFFPETNEIVDEPLLVHARGTVLANVFYYAEAAASPTETAPAESGAETPYRRVDVCGLTVFETVSPYEAYEIQDVSAMIVTDCMLPVRVTNGVCREMTQQQRTRSVAEQKEDALFQAEQLVWLKIPKDAAVVSKQQRIVTVDGVVIGVVGVMTEESIGLEREIVQ